MNKKFLLLAPIAAIALSACSLTGKRYETSEYILNMDITGKDDFKILQLTDTHIGDKDNQDLHYDFMDLTIKDANADFIVVTGDLFTFASKSTAMRFFSWLDSHNTPWTVVFGNHDEQCYFSIDWMTGYLNSFGSNCMFKDLQDDDVHGNCNFAVNLNKGGKTFEQLIFMDSNRYYFGSYFGYDYFKQNQIDWYERLITDTKAANNNELVKSLMFYHIPLPEVNDAWENAETHTGDEREKTCPPDYNSGFFEVIKELGSTNGMFFGHDHVNDFTVEYEGITFSYGLKATDRIYYEDSLLGGQVITLHNDHTFNINQIFHTYKEVM